MPDDLPRPLPPDRQNPLFADQRDPVADHSAIRRAHVVLVRERYRDIRDLRRKETAAEAVAGLDLDGREIFGLTKGQFSLIDIIEAILARTGPAALEISTWTAANTDVSTALAMIAGGTVTRARWLVESRRHARGRFCRVDRPLGNGHRSASMPAAPAPRPQKAAAWRRRKSQVDGGQGSGTPSGSPAARRLRSIRTAALAARATIRPRSSIVAARSASMAAASTAAGSTGSEDRRGTIERLSGTVRAIRP